MNPYLSVSLGIYDLFYSFVGASSRLMECFILSNLTVNAGNVPFIIYKWQDACAQVIRCEFEGMSTEVRIMAREQLAVDTIKPDKSPA